MGKTAEIKALDEEATTNFWTDVQKPYSAYSPKTLQPNRGYKLLEPRLRPEVSKACVTLIQKPRVLWLGGPPGSGKTTIAKRLQEYGFMALDCEEVQLQRTRPNSTILRHAHAFSFPSGIVLCSRNLDAKFVYGQARDLRV